MPKKMYPKKISREPQNYLTPEAAENIKYTQ